MTTDRLHSRTRLVVTGLVFLLIALVWGMHQHRTREWPSGNGRVTDCLRAPVGLLKIGAYVVSYTFSVGDKDFAINERIVGRRSPANFGVPSGVPLPGPNAHIAVSYNPARPTQATIEPGFSPWPFAMGGLGLLFIAIAIITKIFPQAAGERGSSERFSPQF